MNHPTIKQRNKENFNFLKELYFDLIVHFLKRKDLKSVEDMQQGWREIEELYKNDYAGNK